MFRIQTIALDRKRQYPLGHTFQFDLKAKACPTWLEGMAFGGDGLLSIEREVHRPRTQYDPEKAVSSCTT